MNCHKPNVILPSDENSSRPLSHDWTASYKISADRCDSGDESLMQWIELKRSYSFKWQGKTYVVARSRVLETGVARLNMILRHYKVVEENEIVVATYIAEEALGERKGAPTFTKLI
ncbi:hypothetical protein N7504_012162 [Penicillium tannophilum]|nr:hypothetical protein N7504_012162 [Penicillium tannophilum]